MLFKLCFSEVMTVHGSRFKLFLLLVPSGDAGLMGVIVAVYQAEV